MIATFFGCFFFHREIEILKIKNRQLKIGRDKVDHYIFEITFDEQRWKANEIGIWHKDRVLLCFGETIMSLMMVMMHNWF